MEYQISVQRVESQLTGVVRLLAAQSELSRVIPQACGEVWVFFRSKGLPRPGRHVALYLDDKINFECGVEVAQPFAGDERVVCSSTPAGNVATTVHMGPYGRLGDAHSAIHKWGAARGHNLAGPSWELYGHWQDHWNNDPAQIRTDVYYLLQTDPEPAH